MYDGSYLKLDSWYYLGPLGYNYDRRYALIFQTQKEAEAHVERLGVILTRPEYRVVSVGAVPWLTKNY